MNHIRKANIDDALSITKISIDTWKKAYNGLLPQELIAGRQVDEQRVSRWKDNISNSDYTVLVYEDEIVRGYLWGGKKRDNINIPYEIYAIYVMPEYQRAGIGQALIKEYKKQIHNQTFYLYMLKGNTSAAAFYKKIGGKENKVYNRELPIGKYKIEEEIYIFE
jgi:ribosomal protein S18 acetylase RimI-like enzyme